MTPMAYKLLYAVKSLDVKITHEVLIPQAIQWRKRNIQQSVAIQWKLKYTPQYSVNLPKQP